jgi:hypothetical protein
MPEFLIIQERIERRTYIKGKFKGKFIGYLDHRKSDLIHENFYDLEVLSGEIKTTKDESHIRHWQTGEPEEFQPVEQFLTKLPDSLSLEIRFNDGTIKTYQINLNEPKLSNYTLLKQVYDEDKMFGDIEGDISGYIKHYDTQDIEVEINPVVDGTFIIPSTAKVVKTYRQTGKTEVKGNYQRWEYYNSDDSTYWGKWIKTTNENGYTILGLLSWLLQIVFILIFLIPILSVGWKIVLPLIIILAIIYLFSVIKAIIIRLWGWLIHLLSFTFLLFFAFGLISLFTNPINNNPKKKFTTNSDEEKQNIFLDPLTGDSIISHYRIWQDYNNKEYSGYINVTVSHFRQVANYRNNIKVSSLDPNQYNYIVSKIYDFDKNKLSLLYSMFDSLKVKHNLSETSFAEVIASCIQDIPYTLVLDDDCNASIYNDKFISEYLAKGGKCACCIKFGILAPTEFMGSLMGDCDTRTLLLFTVLNHYNYDVAMLGSEIYRHSVLGINLPYAGISKTINGKRYVIWETTEQGFPPGVISREVSDMRFWNVTLISKNNPTI